LTAEQQIGHRTREKIGSNISVSIIKVTVVWLCIFCKWISSKQVKFSSRSRRMDKIRCRRWRCRWRRCAAGG